MNFYKIIMIDIVGLTLLLVFNFLIVSFTEVLMSDALFWEFIIALVIAGVTMAMSRKEIRKAVRKSNKAEKEKSRREFRKSEKISFNFALIAVVLFSLSLYFIPN